VPQTAPWGDSLGQPKNGGKNIRELTLRKCFFGLEATFFRVSKVGLAVGDDAGLKVDLNSVVSRYQCAIYSPRPVQSDEGLCAGLECDGLKGANRTFSSE
jgi:hypothetical protein